MKNLHSTIFKLILKEYIPTQEDFEYLHSTIFKLILHHMASVLTAKQ